MTSPTAPRQRERSSELRSAPDPRPSILLVGFDPETWERMHSSVDRGINLLLAESAEQALRLLAQRAVTVLCVGPSLPGTQAQRLLERAIRELPDPRRTHIVLAAGPDPSIFRELMAEGELFYLSVGPPTPADFAGLIASAAQRNRERGHGEAGQSAELVHSSRVAELARQLAAQRDPMIVERMIVETIPDLVSANRGFCWIRVRRSPERRNAPEEQSWRENPTTGLLGFAAQTGLPLHVEEAAKDPRYETESDGSWIDQDERLIATPIQDTGGQALAVLGAMRKLAQPAFTAQELDVLRFLADQVAFCFRGLELAGDAATLSWPIESEADSRLFRQEALSHYAAAGARQHGDLVRIAPGWTRWSYWLLLALLFAGVLYMGLGTIHEYATGPAVVRFEGRTDLNATAAGTVTSVEVAVGDQVRKGQLLVTFYGVQEAAELERIDREVELQLLERLRNPADEATARALISLRAARDLARARLQERSVHAPLEGLVNDIRVRPGQHLDEGQRVLSLLRGRPEPSVVALLPGKYRPLLAPGLRLRLELEGYRHAPRDLVVDAVGEEVVGPSEARRYLGDEIADTVGIDGPVVLVHARLRAPTFEANGERFEYHDGMQGVAEVPVRSERILLSLVPGLKRLFERSDG